jgi:DNA invertase Pin-like site-specific DNA recombinase
MPGHRPTNKKWTCSSTTCGSLPSDPDGPFTNEYIDQSFAGANTNRPAFADMMEETKKREFNGLEVWKLGRFSRCLRDLIKTLDELESLGIDFVYYDKSLETSSPTGKLVF